MIECKTQGITHVKLGHHASKMKLGSFRKSLFSLEIGIKIKLLGGLYCIIKLYYLGQLATHTSHLITVYFALYLCTKLRNLVSSLTNCFNICLRKHALLNFRFQFLHTLIHLAIMS